MIPESAAQSNIVYKIPVYQEVEKGLYAFLKRSIDEAEEAGAEAIILEINTPGGFVDSAEDIANLLDYTSFVKLLILILKLYLLVHI